MKFIFTILFSFLFLNLLFAQVNPNHVFVKGYTRSDGTVVKPHYRTAPNSTNIDNFSTIGNTNPYTGEPGWIPRDDSYAYSYISNSKGKIRKTYQKTEPIKNYGRQEYWIYNRVSKLAKKALKKDKKFKKGIIKNTKKNRKKIKNKKEADITNFSNGWYNAMVFSTMEFQDSYQEIILDRQVYIENGKITKYIGNNHLAYDIHDFSKSGNSYALKLIFPDNSIGNDYLIVSLYANEKPLNYEPYYEYPSILFFYVTSSNNGGKISVTVENENNVFWGGFIENYWNELPDCQTSQSVAKFYVPRGTYKFFAENNKSLWINNSIKINNDCQGMRLTFN